MVTTVVLAVCDVHQIPEAAQAIADIPEVSEVYSVAGDYDLVIMVRVRHHEDLAKGVTEGILRVPGGEVPVGRLVLEATGHTGFLALRVSVTFDVPPDLEPGEYEVWYCDDPCTGAPIGDLGPSPLAIATEPSRPVARQWAFDEPEIANLASDALIVGPDFEVTADDVRAGRVAPPPEPPPTTAPAPSPTVAAAAPAPAEVAPVASARPAEGMRWRLTTALSLVAAVATGVVLAWRERACAPELASRRSAASGDGRSAAARRG